MAQFKFHRGMATKKGVIFARRAYLPEHTLYPYLFENGKVRKPEDFLEQLKSAPESIKQLAIQDKIVTKEALYGN